MAQHTVPLETMRALWESIEAAPEPHMVTVPPELLPYLRLNERGEFAGFTKGAEPILRRIIRDHTSR